jgi:flagellar biosynthesis/type III secretory pathway chaperone
MKTKLMIDQLIGLLERENEIYQSMLVVIDKERRAAVQSDLNELKNAAEEKENIIANLRRYEEQRIQLTRSMAEAYGYSFEEFTITKLARLVDEPYAGRLIQAKSDLSTVLNVVGDAGQRTKQLFEHSLELLRGSLNLISEMTQISTVYYSSGNIQRTYQTGKCVDGEI